MRMTIACDLSSRPIGERPQKAAGDNLQATVTAHLIRMGNAAITIHHPTSLDHGTPYVESGKIVQRTTNMIRLEKSDSAAVGCGGRIVFKKNVASSQWTFKVTTEISSNYGLGQQITVTAGDNAEAENQLAAKFGMSWSEVKGNVVLVNNIISDSNTYSELYCYVDYNGKNKGTYNWTKNDLDLKATHRWAEDSEMIIDVVF